MCPANERRRYIVTSSPIGWAHTQNDPCYSNVKWPQRHLNWTAYKLLVQQFAQAIKGNIKAPDHWPFVKGIHQWLVESPHKGPLMRKVFPFHDFLMLHWNLRPVTMPTLWSLVLLEASQWHNIASWKFLVCRLNHQANGSITFILNAVLSLAEGLGTVSLCFSKGRVPS